MQDSNEEHVRKNNLYTPALGAVMQKETTKDLDKAQAELALDAKPLDPIVAARRAINMTEDEKKLAGNLLVFTIMFTFRDQDSDLSKLVAKYECELIFQHRAIVAKTLSANHRPAAGSF